MSIHIVRLGTPRAPGEGPRLGTVRRPPRGVPKAEFASRNYYDVWYPLLAPSEATVKMGLAAKTDAQWAAYAKKYRAEMKAPDAARTIAMLAVLSRDSNFAVGCYCEDPARCHRSILRELLEEQDAKLA
jgi:uncharacterized protein YeaO (DUF488 family)